MKRIVAILLVISNSSFGHSGGLDRRGGHIDHSTGIWHSHSGGGGGGGGGGGWAPFVYVEPRRDPPSPEHRAARTAYRDKARTDDARRRLFAAQDEAKKREAKDPAEERESRAAAKLKLAKNLIEKGHVSTAVKWLKEIVEEFPETNAAGEAKLLLVKHGINLAIWYWRMRGVPTLLGSTFPRPLSVAGYSECAGPGKE